MSQVGTASRYLPVVVDSGVRQALPGRGERGTALPGFLSQLIAEHNHMAPQRARRQASPREVLRVYDEGGRLKVLRMPPGYRMDIEA